jgi:hypothetical protein
MERMPILFGADGWPRSYRHYLYGLRYLGLAHMRDQMKLAEAMRHAWDGDKENYTRWLDELKLYTLVPPARKANDRTRS